MLVKPLDRTKLVLIIKHFDVQYFGLSCFQSSNGELNFEDELKIPYNNENKIGTEEIIN